MTIGKYLAVMLAAAAFSGAGWAQQSPDAMSLDVVVTAKNGSDPVSGLTAQDFTVLDNGKPQKIASFEAQGGSKAPVEVILVIDSSNAWYSTVAYERNGIDAFLRANGGHLEYPMQLAVFGDNGVNIQKGFSKDGNAVAKMLDGYTVGLRQITRAAGIYGADERLQLAIKAMANLTAYCRRLPGRKLLIWMSPGWPLLSGPEIQLSSHQQQQIFSAVVGLSADLRAGNVTVYSIDPLGMTDAGSIRTFYYQNFLKGVKKSSQTQYGDLGLQVLAVQTGGRVLYSSNDLTAQLKKVMSDTDAYYHLTIAPTPGEPNEYHKLDVKVDKHGLVARTRTGYYSQ